MKHLIYFSILFFTLMSCTKEVRQNKRIERETTWILSSIGGQVLSEANKRVWTFETTEDNEGIMTETALLDEVDFDPIEYEYLIADEAMWFTDPDDLQTKYDIVHIKKREINLVNSADQLFVLVPKF